MTDLPDFNELGYFSETLQNAIPMCIPDSSPIRKGSTRVQEVGDTNVFSTQYLEDLSVNNEPLDKTMNDNHLNIPDMLAISEQDGSSVPRFALSNLAIKNSKGQIDSGDTDNFAELLLTPCQETKCINNIEPEIQSDMLLQASGFQPNKRRQHSICNDSISAEMINPPHSPANNAKTTATRSMEVIKRSKSQQCLRNEEYIQQSNDERSRKHNTLQSSSQIIHPVLESCPDANNNRYTSLSHRRYHVDPESSLLNDHVSKDNVTDESEQAAKTHDPLYPNQQQATLSPLVHSKTHEPVLAFNQAPNSDCNDSDRKGKVQSSVYPPTKKLPGAPQTQSKRTTSSNEFSDQPCSEGELHHRARQGSWNEFKKVICNLVTGYKKLLTYHGANTQTQRTHSATSLTPNHLTDIGNAITDLSRLVMGATEDVIAQSKDETRQDDLKPVVVARLNRSPDQQTKNAFESDKSQRIRSAVTPETTANQSPARDSRLSQSLSDLKLFDAPSLSFPSCFGVSDHLNADRTADETGTNNISELNVKTIRDAVLPLRGTNIVRENHNDVMPVSSMNYEENLMKTLHIVTQEINSSPETPASDELESNVEGAVVSLIPNSEKQVSSGKAIDGNPGETQDKNAEIAPSNQTTGELAGPSWLNGEVLQYVMEKTGDCMEGKNVTKAILPEALIRKTPREVCEILKVDDHESALVQAVKNYWESNEEFHQIADRLETRLKEKGIKLERRKRMGPEIPAEQKKAIRAQRNRERSQALRKHHKLRIKELESGSVTISNHNRCIRSLIYCLLDKEESLPLVKEYFKDPEKFDDSFLHFLHIGE